MQLPRRPAREAKPQDIIADSLYQVNHKNQKSVLPSAFCPLQPRYKRCNTKYKRGLYRIIRYRPRIDVNLLYQPRPHILLSNPQSTGCLAADALRQKQCGSAKSRLMVPALAAVDTDEYHRSTLCLNHQPAGCSYCLIQGQSY